MEPDMAHTKGGADRWALSYGGVVTVGIVTLLLALLVAAPARAAYEKLSDFGKNELVSASGLAVNVSGAGGVEAGSVYAVGSRYRRVARYTPTGTFQEAWGWGVKNGEKEFQRCGRAPLESCNADFKNLPGGEGAGQLNTPFAIAIDQSNGHVYVLDSQRLHGVIQVFGAKGEVLSSFGERNSLINLEETIAQSPANFHGLRQGGLAVSSSGAVYAVDRVPATPGISEEERIMVFEGGVYTGQAHDIAPFPQGSTKFNLRNLAVDTAGDVYSQSPNAIYEFSPTNRLTPICKFSFPAGGVLSMTVNPSIGAPLFFSEKGAKEIHQLSTCNSQGEFQQVATIPVTPETTEVSALGFNSELTIGSERALGLLYGADGSERTAEEQGIGHIYAQAVSHPPVIEGESVSAVGTASAQLSGRVNLNGSGRYGFQYLPEAAYQANEPDEIQSIDVSASEGLFSLGFEGAEAGGPALGDFVAGSATVTGLRTAIGTGTLKAASGLGTLNGGAGKGTLIAGSSTITSVSAVQGSFQIGAAVFGEGIPAETTITAVANESGLGTQELTISAAATKSAAHTNITSGTTQITALTTLEGSFEVGQSVQGQGIAPKTEITAVSSGELTLSNPTERPGTAVSIGAGSPTVSAVVQGIGSFEPGQKVEGEGVPPGTTIVAVGPGELTLSAPASKAGAGVALSTPGPGPLAAGQTIEGAGIPAGTKIVSANAGELTLSQAATSNGSGVLIRGGLPATTTATDLRQALEGLSTVGPSNVQVAGGPGDQTGANPYRIVFVGALENLDVPQLSATKMTLHGGAATVVVQTLHQGGGGFDAGAFEAPAGGVSLPESSAFRPVGVALSGLIPATRYRYRLVGTNSEGTTGGRPEAFTTYPEGGPSPSSLRAYERVSPAEKHGGEPFPLNPAVGSCGVECKPGKASPPFPRQVSTDGDSIVYSGFAFSPSEGAAVFNEYLSERTPVGWVTKNLSPALLGSNVQGYKAFNGPLSQGLLYQGFPSLVPAAPAEYRNLYLQPSADPATLTPLLTSSPEHRAPGLAGGFKMSYAGASADMSRIFFAANDALPEAMPPAVDGGLGKDNLYEYTEGELRLVNVLPEGTASAPGVYFGAKYKITGTGETADLSHAISEDGSRVFWSDESGQVFVRENATATHEIPDSTGKFLSASSDGARLVLTDGVVFNVNSLDPIADLSEHQGGFIGIAGQSEDLSTIYFVDSAVLNEVPNGEGDVAAANGKNLYAWHEGGGPADFIGTLSGSDVADEATSPWAASPSSRLAEASPDGRWLAVLSQANLLHVRNDVGPCRLVEGPPPTYQTTSCSQVYLYDATTESLTCPSCNPTGEEPYGPSALPRTPGEGEALEEPGQPAYLSNSGRLFFDSQDQLSPADRNGNVEDVYEFAPSGVGGCTRPEGCVSLISSGQGPNDSDFLATDSSGVNLFFTTRDRLVASDRDELIDVYDARDGGGIAGESEAPPGECQAEACQPTVPQSTTSAPASTTFSGEGNVPPEKHKKKQTKKHKKKQKKKHKEKPSRKSSRGQADEGRDARRAR
jgi:hypothetical protein